MQYTCATCGKLHEGLPGLATAAPLYYYSILKGGASYSMPPRLGYLRDRRRVLLRLGCLEIPIAGSPEPFIWGVWTSLSRKSFEAFLRVYNEEHRSQDGPFFGWLSASLKGYPDTENLKTKMHLRDHGQRPFIELEPTAHPLAVEQRSELTVERVGEILASYVHDQRTQPH
jgi:hypothetical protein